MNSTNDNYKPSKAVAFLLRNKLKVTIVVMSVYLIAMTFVTYKFECNWEEIYYISQLIGGFVVVAGLVVSVLQYTESNVANRILRNQERKTKAAEMANKFQEDLIPLMCILSEAYNGSKHGAAILERVSHTKLEMFNKEEVLEIISEEEKNALLSNLQSAYLVKNYKPCNEETEPETGKVLNVRYNEKDIAEAQTIVRNAITKLSNSLEYFSIYFNSGIADDDTVYQSLHGVFFKCVHMIYPYAFYGNKRESDRLFSNTSALYLRWHKIHEELTEEEKIELKELKNRLSEKIVVKVKE